MDNDGLQASRAAFLVACDPCRRNKRKCDRVAPTCGYCMKTGRKCGIPDVYETHLQGSSSKRQRMPKGFVEILESRVEQLENSIKEKSEELQALRCGLGSSNLNLENEDAGDTLVGQDTLGGLESISTDPNQAKEYLENEVQSSDDTQGYPLNVESVISLSKMNEQSESGLFNSMSIARAALASDGRDPFSSLNLRSLFQRETRISHDPALPTFLEGILLSEGDSLLDQFENSYHLTYKFVDISFLRSIIHQCKDQGDLEHFKSASAGDRFRILCVLAITFAIGENQMTFGPQIEGHLFIVALDTLEEVFKLSGPIEQVCALLLLTLYSTIRCSAGSSWHLMGIAMRINVRHEFYTTFLKPGMSHGYQQSIQNAFWPCYMLEQMICRALDRAPSLTEHDLPDYPLQNSADNPSRDEDRVWSYLITRSRLNAKFNNHSSSGSSFLGQKCLRLIHQLKMNQPSETTESLQGLIDSLYLSDLVFYGSQIDPGSARLDKFCLFVSIAHVRRCLHDNESGLQNSWPMVLMIFRAALLCIRSAAGLNGIESNLKGRVELLVSSILSECSEYISRMCADFKGLAPYRSFFDAARLLSRANEIQPGNIASESEWHEKITSLPTAIDQKLAMNTLQVFQTPSPSDARKTGADMYCGLSRVASSIRFASGEGEIFRIIFDELN